MVYETKNINRAAELLGVSRPAVSQNMKELSDQLGIILFNAHPKGVEPTQEADVLYSTISKVVNMINNVESQIRTFNSECSGIINLATHSWFGKAYIDKYLKDFRTQFPNVRLVFSHEENVELLKQKKLDFMINFDYLFKDTNFNTIDILGRDIQGHIVASKNYVKEHGLDKPISLAELVKHPVIDRKEPLQKHVGNLFQTIIEVQSEGQIPSMLRNGIGIGMLNEFALSDLNDPNILKLQIKDFVLPKSRIVCAYNGMLSRPARVFLDGLLKHCRLKHL